MNRAIVSGILFSSPRCVRAVKESLKDEQLKNEWKCLKCFVVGEATGKVLENELQLNYEGQFSGNLSNLLQDISQRAYQNITTLSSRSTYDKIC